MRNSSLLYMGDFLKDRPLGSTSEIKSLGKSLNPYDV